MRPLGTHINEQYGQHFNISKAGRNLLFSSPLGDSTAEFRNIFQQKELFKSGDESLWFEMARYLTEPTEVKEKILLNIELLLKRQYLSNIDDPTRSKEAGTYLMKIPPLFWTL